LDISRARAIELDYRGAVYPLTTIDGTEDCPVWEYWTTEIHINAIIPYVIFLATNTWGNEEYLHTHGLEVLIEQSRFWASRAKFIPYRNGYGINSVTGPDEWQQWVNNNFYTNYMAKWVLEYTLGTIEQMQQSAGEKLNAMVARTGFDLGEMAQWREIAEGLILNYDSELDIYVQDDSFLSMDPMLRKDLDPVKDVPVDKNWTAEKYLKIQTCKQPDVLMAMFLMRSKFTRDEKESNYRFYEPRTAHGSSLSPAIHSIIACDIGEYQQAYDYYLWISRLDLDNMNNNTEEGLHISSMASTWLNIVCGFGGLDYTGPCLSFRPILPKAWESYSFKLLYRASTIEILVDRRGVTYQVLKGDNVRATMYGQDIEITQTPQHAALS
jgi:maltose phosphorylase